MLVYIAGIIIGIVLHYYPDFDIKLATIMYQSVPWYSKFINYLVKLFCLAWAMLTIYSVINKIKKLGLRSIFAVKHYLNEIYLSSVLLLGPGILVHYVIKPFFVRPRPWQTNIFGGEIEFTPVLTYNQLIEANTIVDQVSFVSGHVAAVSAILALTFITQQKRWLYLSILLSLMVGMGRMIEGAHWLSDILFAWIFTYITAHILWKIKKYITINANNI